MVPTFPTKEFMYPSKNNLFPFGSRVNKQFDVFFWSNDIFIAFMVFCIVI